MKKVTCLRCGREIWIGERWREEWKMYDLCDKCKAEKKQSVLNKKEGECD